MNMLKNLLLAGSRSAAALLAFLAVTATAATITNPSFEAQNFTLPPGTIASNGPITGWTAADTTRAGLNPAGGNVFANNGAVPNGSNVLFVLPTNVVSTVISDL